MAAIGCFPDESCGQARTGQILPLYAVPPGWSFSKPSDGWSEKYNCQHYAPRFTYLRRLDGKLRACQEFGGVWTLEDCGLTEDTPVRLQTWYGKYGH